MPRLSKIGAAALAAFGWTGLQTVTADYLVVAGGGGGGDAYGGGGGAGGYLTGTTSLNPTQSYTVTVGAGGAGSTSNASTGNQGSNSVFNAITSTGGGGGGSANDVLNSSTSIGANGGSGGGGAANASGGTVTRAGGSGNTPSTSPSQGNNGGSGVTDSATYRAAGGGGGSFAVGSNGTSGAAGAGGAGTPLSISGASVTYAGGGGGGGFAVTQGAGGSGGGGAGGLSTSTAAVAGTANLGGGGGGAGDGTTFNGASGGSGVVIISYVGAQQFGGGVVTSSGGNTIHTFTTSGTLSPLSSLTASYLLVAGGGGGGATFGGGYGGAGGGGAGGLLSGSGVTIDTNSTYLVTVGASGAGGASAGAVGTNGGNSAFSMVTTTAVGGGGGASFNNTPGNGGSGGGCGYQGSSITGGTGTVGQGNNGGNGSSGSGFNGSGGGGAFAAGTNANSGSTGVAGGSGLPSSISGSSVTYAGGGGSGGYAGGAGGTGGAGGGGDGGVGGFVGNSGENGKGGGGGGGGGANLGTHYNGGNGGSGVVIISYPGSTQQMAGGTVTVAGGNVIHTFTSSGYLTPIVLVNNSLRFRSSAGAYLNRTPATTTNRRTWTWSGWVKRGTLGTNQSLFTCYFANNDTSYLTISFTSDNLNIGLWNTSILYTSAVYRDPSAWYHIVLAIDTTQATASDRAKLYVNGTQVTAFGSTGYPTQNTDLAVNSAAAHYISTYDGTNYKFDGYMADINFVDGQALTPNSFGTSNGLGVWQPIRYGGSYGTNGFYLPFTNTTSTTTLVADSSPNGNNWTPNNISLTAGSTYDSMNDVPTLTSATTANYATINPLDYNSTYLTLSAANLQQTYGGVSAAAASRATMTLPTTGKWYWEVYINATGGGAGERIRAGICSPTTAISGNSIDGSATSYLQMSNGQKRNNSTDSTYGSGFSAGQTIQIAYDATAGAIYFGQNGSYANGTGSFNQAFSGATAAFTSLSGEFMPCFITYGGADIAVNFGQRPFAYTPPTGFVALNTFNLTTPTIGATASTTANKYFDATLYTGNSSTQTVTNSGSMQPDFIWVKSRTYGSSHGLVDSVRGLASGLNSNAPSLQTTLTDSITSINSNGFSLGADSTTWFNYGGSYVAWQWKANGTGVTNTAGSIISTVSANTTAGFSIVTYTGVGGSGTTTVGHGLGVSPSMVIIKRRNSTADWATYHTGLTSTSYYLFLNSTAGEANYGSTFISPSDSTLTIDAGSSLLNTSTGTYVAYCFAQVAGYSAFGSYTGNGATDGPFIYTGFRPRFVMIKRTSSGTTGNWSITDTAINPYNNTTGALRPNTADSESTVGTVYVQPLSNGFKITNNNTDTNGSSTYIYMAFAENPFKYANAR